MTSSCVACHVGVCNRQEASYDGSVTYNISTLMGRRDQDEQIICARRLVEGVSFQGCSRYCNLWGISEQYCCMSVHIVSLSPCKQIWFYLS